MLILVIGGFYVWLAYGKAREKNRNPIKWAAAAAVTFIGTQIIAAGVIGFILGFGEEAWGWSADPVRIYNLQILIVTLLACAFMNWLVMRPLNKIQTESFTKSPPGFEHRD